MTNEKFAEKVVEAELPLPEIVGYRVLVDMSWRHQQIAPNIVIPDNASVRENEGVVVAIGNGRHSYREEVYPFDVKVGDRVLVSSFGGVDLHHGDKLYKVVSAEDIIAVWRERSACQTCPKF